MVIATIATIQDLIAYLRSGQAYGQAIRLDDDQLELVYRLARGLANVASSEQRHD